MPVLGDLRDGEPLRGLCDMAKRQLLIGERFGRAVIIGYAENGYTCRCDCGRTFTNDHVAGFRNGRIKSCGCLRRDKFIAMSTRHGKSYSRVRNCWANMIQRCTNRNHPHWKNYGGRGISVCDRWLNFENFYRDMGDPPEELSIDRVNNDGNYELQNCRWASRSEQQNNRRGAGFRVTHCPQGHEYSQENTIIGKNHRRKCRTCNNRSSQ